MVAKSLLEKETVMAQGDSKLSCDERQYEANVVQKVATVARAPLLCLLLEYTVRT